MAVPLWLEFSAWTCDVGQGGADAAGGGGQRRRGQDDRGAGRDQGRAGQEGDRSGAAPDTPDSFEEAVHLHPLAFTWGPGVTLSPTGRQPCPTHVAAGSGAERMRGVR